MYCKSIYSRYHHENSEKLGIEPGWNPIYQGRSVTQYNKSHESIELDEFKEEEIHETDETLYSFDAPCGTDAQKIEELS